MHALTAFEYCKGLHIVLGYSTPQWSRWEVRRKPPSFRGHGGWDSRGADAQEQSFTDTLKSGNVDSSILLEMARNDPCAHCRLQSVKNSERSGFFFATPFPFATHSPTPNSKPGPEARPVPSIFLPYLACKENKKCARRKKDNSFLLKYPILRRISERPSHGAAASSPTQALLGVFRHVWHFPMLVHTTCSAIMRGCWDWGFVSLRPSFFFF